MTAWTNADGDTWAREMQRRIFCVSLGVISLALAFIVGRSWLEGGYPWADTFALVVIFVILLVAPRHPGLVRMLMWLTLGAMLLDVADGMFPVEGHIVTPTHLFLPMLVLYGVVLGEMTMSLVTGAVVFAIYGLTWYAHRPLKPEDATHLGNLMMVSLGSGLLAYSVWVQGRGLVADLQRRAADLRRQLDSNQRLTAVLSHDIVNPLNALQCTLEHARPGGGLTEAEVAVAERMTERIAAIIVGVRELNRDANRLFPLAPVPVQALWSELDEVFAQRLAVKAQRFVLVSGQDLQVNTDVKILGASVLGNMITNACKFSPAGAVIEMSARREGSRVRILLRNPGAGFSEQELRCLAVGQPTGSRLGTEGEKGDGTGLRIARFYLQRLQGDLVVANDADGAAISVFLPAAP